MSWINLCANMASCNKHHHLLIRSVWSDIDHKTRKMSIQWEVLFISLQKGHQLFSQKLYSRILNFLLGQFNQNSWHGICQILSSLACSNYIWVNWCLHKKSKWWSCEMFLLYDIRNVETQLVCPQLKPNKEKGRGCVIFRDSSELPTGVLRHYLQNLEYLLLLYLKKTPQSHQNWHRQ